jgi:hypothetical protein
VLERAFLLELLLLTPAAVGGWRLALAVAAVLELLLALLVVPVVALGLGGLVDVLNMLQTLAMLLAADLPALALPDDALVVKQLLSDIKSQCGNSDLPSSPNIRPACSTSL